VDGGAQRRSVGPRYDAETVVRELDAFLDDVVVPLESEHADLLRDPGRRFDSLGIRATALVDLERQVRTRAAGAGLYGLMVPAELGGRELDPFCQYVVWEHLYARSGPDRPLPYEAIGRFTSGPGAALRGMSPAVRTEIWPTILSGEQLLCFALSESGTSGTPTVRTRATPVPGGFRITGTKRWVSRGGYADFALVYAVVSSASSEGHAACVSRSEESPTAFLIRLDEPGVRLVGPTRILGRTGGDEVTLDFDCVELPSDRVVGELHGGDAVARSGSLATTMFTAGRFLGLARWALERTRAVIGRGEAVMDTIESEELLADATAEWRKLDFLARRGAHAVSSEDRPSTARLVQALAPSMCGRAYETAMRVEGAEALTNGARLFDGWHQAMIVRVAQARMESIARELEGRLRRRSSQAGR